MNFQHEPPMILSLSIKNTGEDVLFQVDKEVLSKGFNDYHIWNLVEGDGMIYAEIIPVSKI